MISVELEAHDMGALRKRIVGRAQEFADRLCVQAAEEMEDEVVGIIRDLFIEDRPPHRRKKGRMRLVNSFEGVAVGLGTPNARAVLRTKPGADTGKIGALNNGSPPHSIDPVNGEFLWFPDPRRGGGPQWNAFGPNNFKSKHVDHPGNDPYLFMEQARDQVRTRLVHQMAREFFRTR